MRVLAKGALGVSQLPHRWGPQRDFLLRCWELSPSYYYLTGIPEPSSLSIPQGYMSLNRPTNLERPKGPSLRGLWAYIKANPNEGY
jgi:hypothetical protein